MNQFYRRNGRSPAWIVVAIWIVTGGAALTQAQEKPASIVVARVVEREVNTGHRVVGTVMPARKSTVGSAVDGRVIDFLVDRGDFVKQGRPLARLSTETLEIELAAAEAEWKLRKEELAEQENGSRPEEIAEARARMLAARAVMRNAASKLKRVQSLFDKNAINQADLDDARERSDAANQLLLAAEAVLKRIEAGPRKEQIAQAQARVQLQREQVRLIEDRITKSTIVAPFDGFVSAEHTEVGEWISQGDPVAEVIQLDEVEVLSHVPAEHAMQLEQRLPIRIEFPALPGEVFTGKVVRIVPTADLRTRTFPVKIRLKNRMSSGLPLLMAGMLARAELPTGKRTRMPLVPKDALVLKGTRRSIFIVDFDAENRGSVRSVPVELGVADGTLIQIEAPVRAGQLVVVRGNERLKNGQKVSITKILAQESERSDR